MRTSSISQDEKIPDWRSLDTLHLFIDLRIFWQEIFRYPDPITHCPDQKFHVTAEIIVRTCQAVAWPRLGRLQASVDGSTTSECLQAPARPACWLWPATSLLPPGDTLSPFCLYRPWFLPYRVRINVIILQNIAFCIKKSGVFRFQWTCTKSLRFESIARTVYSRYTVSQQPLFHYLVVDILSLIQRSRYCEKPK